MLKIHQDFRQLFYKREGTELLGKRYYNLWVLFMILLVTFLAIGFANGSLAYLSKKMSDPFVNWLNVQIPYGKAAEATDIQIELDNNGVAKEKYLYKTVNCHKDYSLEFYNSKRDGFYATPGRSIDLKDTLLHVVLGPKNFIRGEKTFRDEQDLGIIVTERLLDEYGYDRNASYLMMAIYADSATIRKDTAGVVTDTIEYRARDAHQYPLPIRAVVRDLPGLARFAFTPYLYRIIAIRSHENPFNPLKTKNILLYSQDSLENLKVVDAVDTYFKKHEKYSSSYQALPTSLSNADLYSSYKNGYLCNISFLPEITDIKEKDKLYKDLMASAELAPFKGKINRAYDPKPPQNFQNIPYDFISVQFYQLSRIREFKDSLLYPKYNLKVDMAQIEALENYNFVSKLTFIISIVLIIFSVLSICLFISNVLRTHLDKIKMNLGTFKAFGLDNSTIQGIYWKLMIGLTSFCILTAFAVAWVIGNIGGVRLFLSIFQQDMEADEYYFKLFDVTTFVAIALIIIMVFFVIRYVCSIMLKQSPGDLIYNRD